MCENMYSVLMYGNIRSEKKKTWASGCIIWFIHHCERCSKRKYNTKIQTSWWNHTQCTTLSPNYTTIMLATARTSRSLTTSPLNILTMVESCCASLMYLLVAASHRCTKAFWYTTLWTAMSRAMRFRNLHMVEYTHIYTGLRALCNPSQQFVILEVHSSAASKWFQSLIREAGIPSTSTNLHATNVSGLKIGHHFFDVLLLRKGMDKFFENCYNIFGHTCHSRKHFMTTKKSLPFSSSL